MRRVLVRISVTMAESKSPKDPAEAIPPASRPCPARLVAMVACRVKSLFVARRPTTAAKMKRRPSAKYPPPVVATLAPTIAMISMRLPIHAPKPTMARTYQGWGGPRSVSASISAAQSGLTSPSSARVPKT